MSATTLCPNIQVVGGHPISQAIPLTFDLDVAYLPQGLFHGVDAQVDRPHVSGQLPGQGGLTGAEQTGEDDKNGHDFIYIKFPFLFNTLEILMTIAGIKSTLPTFMPIENA